MLIIFPEHKLFLFKLLEAKIDFILIGTGRSRDAADIEELQKIEKLRKKK